MPSITMPIALGVGAIGSLGSAAMSAGAAESAAQTQAGAAEQSAELQMQMYNQNVQRLNPYVQSGYGAMNELDWLMGVPSSQPGANGSTGAGTSGTAGGGGTGGLNALFGQGATPGSGTGGGATPFQGTGVYGSLTSPFNPTMAQLSQTPGYQFTLGQGLMATQNSFAAQGLGSSGAAMKGAAQYAEGLASTTYQQQFNNYWAQNQSIYNELMGMSGLGENAAAMVGNNATATGQSVGNTLTSGAAATAAGTVGAANAASGGLSGLSSSALMLAMANNGLFGAAGGGGMSNAMFDNITGANGVPV